MKDYFSLLGEPRRPWIDTAELKSRFLAGSAATHPDRLHQAARTEKEAATSRAADLNAAYQCLRDPRSRLRHLLELERGDRILESPELPASVIEFFSEVHQVLKAVDAALAEKSVAATAIRKAQLFEQMLPLLDRLRAAQTKIQTRLQELDQRMLQLNLAWESAPPPGSPLRVNMLPCSRLEHLHHELSFLQRWNQQLHERAVQLSL